MSKRWTKEEDDELEKIYSDKGNVELGRIFNCTDEAIRYRAYKLGLEKSQEFKYKNLRQNQHEMLKKAETSKMLSGLKKVECATGKLYVGKGKLIHIGF